MGISGLGTRQEKTGGGSILTFLGLMSGMMMFVGIMMFGSELVAYSSQDFNALQSDVLIAGIQVGGLNESEAQKQWEAVYLDQPITLRYNDSPIVLTPRQLGFRTNNDAMLAEARAAGKTNTSFWSGFIAHLLNETPEPIRVALDAEVQEGQIRTVLEDVALRYDLAGGTAGFDPETLTFTSGGLGSSLDVDQAIQMVRSVLFNPNPDQRVVQLPTQGVAGGSASMDDLRGAILQYMSSQGFLPDAQTTIGSVFVMDLNTGEEMSIYGDVAHSAVSTIKIGIMINYFRYQVTAPDPDTAYLMASAIICSHNPGANFLVQVTSDSRQDIQEGLLRASETFREMGAVNSWISSPLWVGPDGAYPVVYPQQQNPEIATSNPNLNAEPDPLNQSTAEDMGIMMALIYDCANFGGGLMAVFPEEITQEECQQMIEILSGVKFFRFSELGVPEGVEIAHKVGYGQETVGDVAMVFSPNTDYVFVMYIWEDDIDNDSITELDKWELIDETSRIVYNYFNADAPLAERRAPVNPLGGAACVLPLTSEEININNIDANRFDTDGVPVPSACYDWPVCKPFDNWGLE